MLSIKKVIKEDSNVRILSCLLNGTPVLIQTCSNTEKTNDEVSIINQLKQSYNAGFPVYLGSLLLSNGSSVSTAFSNFL